MFILKKIFSTTSRPISIKLGTNHPWVKEILNYTNKGPGPFQRGDNHKNAKIIEKSFSLRTTDYSYFYESFLRQCRFKLVQIMVPKGQGWGHKRGNSFYICILERIF
jgi:hypothetical protein